MTTRKYQRYGGRQKIDGRFCDVYVTVSRGAVSAFYVTAEPAERSRLLSRFAELFRDRRRIETAIPARPTTLRAWDEEHGGEFGYVERTLDGIDDFISAHTWDLIDAWWGARDSGASPTAAAKIETDRAYRGRPDLPERARKVILEELEKAAAEGTK